MNITYDASGEQLLFSDDVRFDINKSADSIVQIKIRKDADGSSFSEARERAGKIDYGYAVEGNTIVLDNFLTTAIESKARDQEVRSTISIPVGTVVTFEMGARRYIGRITRYDQDMYRGEIVDYQWVMQENGRLHCLDCPEDLKSSDWDDEEGRIIINEDGIDINVNDNGESFEMKIDENGVKIKSNENRN
jgi:hypothetical protein